MTTIACQQQPDGRVRFLINVGIGDPINWSVSIYSNVDYGRGSTGSHDPAYPHWVENFSGSNTQTLYRTYSYPGGYIGTLAPATITGGYAFCYFNTVSCTLSTLSLPNFSVAVGGTFQLTVACRDSCGNWVECPTSGISWSSDNSSVANLTSISGYNATVTGVSAGTTTIRVSYGGISTSCTATVTGGGCTNPKYKCIGTQCVSDNCDGSGIYTTSNCNNACNPLCTNPKYKCIGTQCVSDNCDGSGTYLTFNCDNVCLGGGGGLPTCDPTTCPSDKNFCLAGTCIPKTYVIGGAVVFFAIMMLK